MTVLRVEMDNLVDNEAVKVYCIIPHPPAGCGILTNGGTLNRKEMMLVLNSVATQIQSTGAMLSELSAGDNQDTGDIAAKLGALMLMWFESLHEELLELELESDDGQG